MLCFNRLVAAALAVALAVPPAAFGQQLSDAPPSDGPPLEIGPLNSSVISLVPPGIASGVFGPYGSKDSRLAGGNGTANGNASLRAPLTAVQLPDLGDGSGGALTLQEERKVGERVMRQVRRGPGYLADWLTRDYLNSVAARLAAAASAQYIGGYKPDFQLFAIRDPQINAFSMPGGFIGINTGLFVTTQTESELASVIGHEMGHVLQRHIARMIAVNERSGYAALAGVLFGILAGMIANSGDLGSAIVLGGHAYAVDEQLRFSRAAEHEADRVGFQMLAAAGYDPYGMPSFFERLERASMSDAGVPAYARTHPLTTDRLADIEDRARRAPYRQPRQSPEFGFVRARLRVLQDRSPSEYAGDVRRFTAEIEDKTAPNVAANWYGIAVAQMLIGRYDAADAALDKARRIFTADEVQEGEVARSSPSLDVLASDIARRAGRADDAVRLGEIAQRRWPGSHAAIDIHLQALLAARRFADAQALALQATRADPDEPAWWRYLARASAGAGDALAQHRATAEALALEGAWPSAVRQLKAARDIEAIDFYDLSIVKARLHEFEARYKAEREDERNMR
ncbi:M48 family metallopeptidase [Trinickia violacea]|uniref:M48 family metallopeptidase n=1 Tax=Trinickia violacea TaxID=2571746 RepID=A0A4P8IKI8_9BURK|nr:M48 family metalloprotease [Trinickia violacea]QCP48351.1 M48 family metallopeptidase [Trinickia violacea]